MDKNYDEYYKHLTGEKLAFVMKQNAEIEEKTRLLRKMMDDFLSEPEEDSEENEHAYDSSDEIKEEL